jgi:RNA polymerase sigma-70 factor (ECF subfamily)
MRLTLRPDPSQCVPVAEDDPLPPDDRAMPRQTMDALYRAHRPVLLRLARRLATPDRAQDIVQRLFVRIAGRGPHHLAEIRAPEAYLQQATLNLLRDEARSASRRSAHLHLCDTAVDLYAADQIAALEARDMLNRLEAVLLRLPPRTREIFLAHRLDGYSYAEIAARTGLSIKTVEKHMSRAIAHLGRHAERW